MGSMSGKSSRVGGVGIMPITAAPYTFIGVVVVCIVHVLQNALDGTERVSDRDGIEVFALKPITLEAVMHMSVIVGLLFTSFTLIMCYGSNQDRPVNY